MERLPREEFFKVLNSLKRVVKVKVSPHAEIRWNKEVGESGVAEIVFRSKERNAIIRDFRLEYAQVAHLPKRELLQLINDRKGAYFSPGKISVNDSTVYFYEEVIGELWPRKEKSKDPLTALSGITVPEGQQISVEGQKFGLAFSADLRAGKDSKFFIVLTDNRNKVKVKFSSDGKEELVFYCGKFCRIEKSEKEEKEKTLEEKVKVIPLRSTASGS